MAVLLAVLTFVLFVAMDYLITRRRAARERLAMAEAPAARPAAESVPIPEPVWVSGYELPEQLHYHRGHMWARVLSPDTVAVGIDDFARKLIGKARKVKLPSVGAWMRQGGKAFGVKVNGRGAEMVSPVEGEVIEVNRELSGQPNLCTDDPYGRGWLCKIRSANLAANLRNLFSGGLARRWTEEARAQIEIRLMALSGSVLQDGGEPSVDFGDHLETEDWKRLVSEFLLT